MTPLLQQTLLAGVALAILAGLGGALVFVAVPGPNTTLLATIVGALAGALTVSGTSRPSTPPNPNPNP